MQAGLLGGTHRTALGRARHRLLARARGPLACGAGLVLLVAFTAAARAIEVDAGALMNWSCLNLRIGACVCGVPPKPCLRVTYNEPRLLIHTWASPSAKPGHESPQQFHEATVGPFPLSLVLGGFTFACSVDWSRPGDWLASGTEGVSAGAHYSSLLDAVAWRTGAVEMWAAQSFGASVTTSLGACAFGGLAGQIGITLPGLGSLCMGNWGPLFARTGWLVHPSEPVGSAAAAYRAAHILSHLELMAGRVVPWPATDFRASTADLMNLSVPRLTPCFAPGTPPIAWEHGTTSPVGQYVWIYWVTRSCCISPTLLARGADGSRVAAVAPGRRAPRVTGAPPPTNACRMAPLGFVPVAFNAAPVARRTP